ncbi:MAG: hypothetical protein H6825_08825 [Planctomycetes bacterium]|nr:hypothetical protein [Planctomycetota bacterium]
MALDLEKVVLGFMGLLIVGGIGVTIWQRNEADELKQRMATSERQLVEIGRRYVELTTLKTEIDRDLILKGELRPLPYFENQMRKNGIKAGDLTIAPGNTEQLAGYKDTVWELRSTNRNRNFGRREIANFLLFVENEANTLKVSRLTLDHSSARDAGPDDWSPRIWVTQREATGL